MDSSNRSSLRRSVTHDDERQRGGSFNGSVLSDGSFLGDESEEKRKGRRVINPNAKFVDKNEWKSNTKCNVCSRGFEKLKRINEHHCRVCGYAICGECSKKRINDERVCDICFFKNSIEAHEKRREELVKSRGEIVSKADFLLQKRRDELLLLQNKMKEIKKDIENSEDQQKKTIQMFYKEKEKGETYLNEKKETLKNFRKGVDVNRKAISEKESRAKELRIKLDELKDQIDENRLDYKQANSTFQKKKSEFDTLEKQKETLDAQRHHRHLDDTPSESDKVSFVSNVTGQDEPRDGAYNISLQPVNNQN